MQTVLPPEVANALTEIIPEPPNKQAYHDSQYTTQPVDVQPQAPLVTYQQADVQDSQVGEHTAAWCGGGWLASGRSGLKQSRCRLPRW